jgi:dolichol-phosphate mannosyltransferase
MTYRATRQDSAATISVVLPLFNEGAVLRRLADAVREAIRGCRCCYELVFVNDGSTDDSAAILDEMAAADENIRVVHLSRNFGHQAALQAGLKHMRGDAALVMDTDLQDDPAGISMLIEKWREGYDVVYALRSGRKEAAWKRGLFRAFYKLLASISDRPIPRDAGNFSLLDGRVARQISGLAEYDRYFPGLRHWVGFRQIGVRIPRQARHDARPRVSLRGLFMLAKTAIFSFSRLPLTAFYVIAGMSLALCCACAAFTLYHRLFTGLAIPGWTSITITASFFGALNALGIGILGEYVVRIYDQVRSRPQYIVERTTHFAAIDDPAEEQIWNEMRDLRDVVPSRPNNPPLELVYSLDPLSAEDRPTGR